MTERPTHLIRETVKGKIVARCGKEGVSINHATPWNDDVTCGDCLAVVAAGAVDEMTVEQRDELAIHEAMIQTVMENLVSAAVSGEMTIGSHNRRDIAEAIVDAILDCLVAMAAGRWTA